MANSAGQLTALFKTPSVFKRPTSKGKKGKERGKGRQRQGERGIRGVEEGKGEDREREGEGDGWLNKVTSWIYLCRLTYEGR